MEVPCFERMVLRHKDRLHSYAALMLRDRTEAEDVSQEALVRLWRHRREVDAPAARQWLTRTVHNLCIDRLRKRKVRAEVADGETALRWHRDDAPGPEQLAGADEIGQRMLQALDSLTATDRAVLVLREVQGLPYEEIAGVMRIPLGTLKARLHRARDRLRERLTRAGVAP